MYFPHLNISCMLRIVGIRSTVLQSIVIESSIANQVNEEKKRERTTQLISNYHCCTYQERSVVSSFRIQYFCRLKDYILKTYKDYSKL